MLSISRISYNLNSLFFIYKVVSIYYFLNKNSLVELKYSNLLYKIFGDNIDNMYSDSVVEIIII